jgi:O-antigen/teichoic acid export membrane protein
MGLWSTNEEIGIFSASHRLTIMIINLISLVIWGLYPTMSNLYVTDRDNFKKAQVNLQKFIVGSAIPVCAVANMFSKEIIISIFGQEYIESIMIFNILIWLTFLVALRRSFAVALLSADFHRLNMFATGIGVAVVILSSIALIPFYGGYGATWALIGGEIFAFVIINELFRKKLFRSGLLGSYSLKVLFASTVMILLLFNLPFSKIMSVVTAILIYSLLSVSIGIISKKTIQQLYQKVFG